MKRFHLCVAALALLPTLPLAADDGAVGPKAVERFRAQLDMDGPTRAVYNAVTNNDIRALAVNRDVLRQHNEVFGHKIKVKRVTNQKKSGRCWLFAGLNVLRPVVIEKHKLEDFEFSENYLAFWDKLEKANSFLEFVIEMADRDPLDREMAILLDDGFYEGGWWCYVVELVEKYGAVPKEAMPETNSSENSRLMHAVIERRLKVGAMKLRAMHRQGKSLEALRAEKQKMLAEVYRLLVINLGEPPTKFSWRPVDKDSKVGKTRTYSPQSFYKKVVGVDLRQYVNLTNDPTQKYGKHYALTRTQNVFGTRGVHYANVEIDVLKTAAMASVLDDRPVWFAADMGRDQDSERGIMAAEIHDYQTLFGIDLRMSKPQRMMFDEGASNHAMIFIGVDVHDEHPEKWLVENSWGKERGDGGFWTLYDSWFDEHVYSVIVPKEYVPKKVLAVFDRPAKVLPPWYPTASPCR